MSSEDICKKLCFFCVPVYLSIFKPVVQDVVDFFQPTAIVLQVSLFYPEF